MNIKHIHTHTQTQIKNKAKRPLDADHAASVKVSPMDLQNYRRSEGKRLLKCSASKIKPTPRFQEWGSVHCKSIFATTIFCNPRNFLAVVSFLTIYLSIYLIYKSISICLSSISTLFVFFLYMFFLFCLYYIYVYVLYVSELILLCMIIQVYI